MADAPKVIPPLDEAVTTFLATRSSYPSPAEQAEASLLLALTRAVATQGGPGSAELLAELRRLRAEVAELRQAQNILDPSAELAQLRAEVAELRAALSTTPARALPPRRSTLGGPPAPSAYPTEIRPLEYWAENMPDFGEDPSPQELRAALERPRVRPEDVVVTEEELAQQAEIQGRVRRPRQPTLQERIVMLVFVVLVVVLASVLLWSWVANFGLRR